MAKNNNNRRFWVWIIVIGVGAAVGYGILTQTVATNYKAIESNTKTGHKNTTDIVEVKTDVKWIRAATEKQEEVSMRQTAILEEIRRKVD